ncbi:hypothetical protein BgiMline_012287, partial [Biomphalaria glabrata]
YEGEEFESSTEIIFYALFIIFVFGMAFYIVCYPRLIKSKAGKHRHHRRHHNEN